MTKTVKCYKLPASANALAKKVYDDMAALMTERVALINEYKRELLAVEEKFNAPALALAMRINEIKLKGSEDLCRAAGVTYDSTCGYAIDTSYIEDCGMAFIQEVPRTDGLRFDDMMEDVRPAGTRLN